MNIALILSLIVLTVAVQAKLLVQRKFEPKYLVLGNY